MHDYFDVIGLPGSAGPLDARRVSARYVRRCHPDFRTAEALAVPALPLPRSDAAIAFIEPSTFLDRIQTAFFAEPPSA